MSFGVRVGIGYDAHRLVEGRPCVLGGVEIAHPRGLEGYSDADALLHAIMDAMLGAAGLADIGKHFPPGDERFHNVSSLRLLATVRSMVEGKGWRVANVDSTLMAEEPRIGPHVAAMKQLISSTLGISGDDVGIKATTNEGMGFVGRGEGIAAMAVVLLCRGGSEDLEE